MFKKLCLIMILLITLLEISILSKQNDSSKIKSMALTSLKWDKDRAVRLPENSLFAEDFSKLKMMIMRVI